MDVLKEFEWRELVYGASDGLAAVLARGRVTVYSGFDPTARSLHVGNLMPILALRRLQHFGHAPITLVGGGTGLIGDPSGKSQERTLMTLDQVEANATAIREQLARFLEFERGTNAARMTNNADWLVPLDLMTILRDTGKYFTVNYMLAKESVKRRLESAEGISYTEFSYLLLQAYDFLVLYDRYGCELQLGGSDQWGNITAGCDLIRKMRGGRAHGLVLPLITTAGGAKFGKTEAGTVWLNGSLTTPFRFYQYWLNTDDRDCTKYLKYFTFLSRDAIGQLDETVTRAPERREAQRVLAREVTTLVHGEDATHRAERASGMLFGEDMTNQTAEDVLVVFDDVPSTEVDRQRFADTGVLVADLLASTGLVSSKSEATRLIRSGGIYVNNRRVTEGRARLTVADAVEGRLLILRKGQRQHHLVKFE